MLKLRHLSSLGEALRDALWTHKSNVALIEANRDRENIRFTYREFHLEAERVTRLLQQQRFRPGDRCAILMQNQSKWPISATGAFWAGAILVPLDYKLTASEQAALLGHAKPKVLITEWQIWMQLRKERTALPKNMAVFVSEVPATENDETIQRWDGRPKGKFRYVERTQADVACIVYSSGTGGKAKGCMLTHANYLSQAEELARLYPMQEDERYFSILPTNHAIDFMCGFFLPLQFGAAVVYQRTLRPEFLASTMQRYGITHMALVPMILKALERRIRDKLAALPRWKRLFIESLIFFNAKATQKRPNHKLSRRLLKPLHDGFGGRLRYIFAGGSFVDPEAAAFFYRLGIPVVIGYGLTEAGTVLTVNDLRPFRSDTVGKPIPNVELELRDQNDVGVGEVWVKGPTVMKGYLDEPDLTSEVLVDGWLRTGDLGVLDAAGHLKLVGRAKNMIVTEGGKNIYPEDVEQWFDDLEGCEEHCVFASNYIWPSGKLTDEKLMIVIRPKSDAENRHGSQLHGRLKERNQRLADYKRLAGFVVWEEAFPRTASLKVKRNELAQTLRNKVDRRKVWQEI